MSSARSPAPAQPFPFTVPSCPTHKYKGGTSPMAFRAITLAAFATWGPPWQLDSAHLFCESWVRFSQVPQSTSAVKKTKQDATETDKTTKTILASDT